MPTSFADNADTISAFSSSTPFPPPPPPPFAHLARYPRIFPLSERELRRDAFFEGETLHLSSLMPFTSRRLFSRIRCFISVKNRAAPRYSPFLFRKSDRDEEAGKGGDKTLEQFHDVEQYFFAVFTHKAIFDDRLVLC